MLNAYVFFLSLYFYDFILSYNTNTFVERTLERLLIFCSIAYIAYIFYKYSQMSYYEAITAFFGLLGSSLVIWASFRSTVDGLSFKLPLRKMRIEQQAAVYFFLSLALGISFMYFRHWIVGEAILFFALPALLRWRGVLPLRRFAHRPEATKSAIDRLAPFFSAFLLAVFGLFLYASVVFPLIPRQLGGGRALPVQLVFNHNVPPFIAAEVSMSPDTMKSQVVWELFETDKTIVMSTYKTAESDEAAALAIDKDFVAAVVYPKMVNRNNVHGSSKPGPLRK